MHPQESQEPREFSTAREAVDQLGLIDFIKAHKALIYEKIKECDKRVEDAKKEGKGEFYGDMTFIATCLPLAAGIVHVGSTLDKFKEAQNSLGKGLGLLDPTSVLSALTLLYLVQTGWENNKEDETWKRIRQRVVRFLESQGPSPSQEGTSL
jgi:hypothetical protein